MKLALVDDAKSVFLKSYSSLLAIVSAVTGALAAAQPDVSLLQGVVSQKVFATVSIVCAVAVPFARIIRQERFGKSPGDGGGDPQ